MASVVSPALTRLRTSAIVILASVVIQLGLGIGILSGHYGMRDAHGWFGYLTFLASLAAAVFAWQLSKADPAAKGTFMHAASMPVLAIIQIGLAEMANGNDALKWVHVVLGIAFLVMAVGLYMVSSRRAARA